MLALNIFELFVSVVLISTLYDDKLSDVAQLIHRLTHPDTSLEYFVSVHEQSLNDGDLIARQFISLNSPFLKEPLYVYAQMC